MAGPSIINDSSNTRVHEEDKDKETPLGQLPTHQLRAELKGVQGQVVRLYLYLSKPRLMGLGSMSRLDFFLVFDSYLISMSIAFALK